MKGEFLLLFLFERRLLMLLEISLYAWKRHKILAIENRIEIAKVKVLKNMMVKFY